MSDNKLVLYRDFEIYLTPWGDDGGDYAANLYDLQQPFDYGQVVHSLPYADAVDDAKYVADEIRNGLKEDTV